MKIELSHRQKIALLEAVQSGTLDTSIYERQDNEPQNIEDIEREIIRLEILELSNSGLLALSELMRDYARGKLPREEYITKRIELINKY
ncbi:MAG: hypothetical protein E7110_09145 [Bacteroidales bacterium]|nr:hypothetical protein [Bacteroidales bacterium]